jgi:hypothetical protein
MQVFMYVCMYICVSECVCVSLRFSFGPGHTGSGRGRRGGSGGRGGGDEGRGGIDEARHAYVLQAYLLPVARCLSGCIRVICASGLTASSCPVPY